MKPGLTVLVPILLIFICFQSALHPQNLKNKFYIGTFSMPIYSNYWGDTRYGQLSFNLMQGYGRHDDTDATNLDGGFYDAVSSYSYNINATLGAWYTYSGENSMIFEREKLLRPAYGKRSDYQAEYTPSQITGGSVRPAYGFDYSNGSAYSETWQGESVSGRNTGIPSDPVAGYFLVKGLHENHEQDAVSLRGKTGNEHDLAYMLSNTKKAPFYYFIKPRMRIDSVYAQSNPNTQVVKIIALAYNGDTVLSQIITCRNFLDANTHYNGRYLEMFYQLPDTAFRVAADSMIAGAIVQKLHS